MAPGDHPAWMCLPVMRSIVHLGVSDSIVEARRVAIIVLSVSIDPWTGSHGRATRVVSALT